MKAAVYNRFWHSLGGGERYAGMIASTLAADGHDVDLIGPMDVDLDKMARHLSLDLTGVKLRIVKDDDESKVAEVSADYDLFVTSTYMSRLRPRAARSAYVCFFPTPPDHELSDRARRVVHWLDGRIQTPSQIRGFGYGTGWFPPEGGLRHRWAWSNGTGVLELPHGGDETFSLVLGRPGIPEPVDLAVVDQDGTEIATILVREQFHRFEVVVPRAEHKRRLELRSPTFRPPADNRALGIAIGRDTPASWLAPRRMLVRAVPWITTPAHDDLRFLSGYDSTVTISDYTQSWVSRLWGVDSDLLYPPIDVDKMRPEPVRDKAIITIGRFFDPVRGHSKRQLEMVEIFRKLVDSGRVDGWTFHLVGGCEVENRPYFEKVMAASEGLPIKLHPNAPRHVLEHLINTASIFWSATGMNENTEKRPWRNEHFGMTTSEAMAAGCVPVVIDRAGQREIVRDGIDGYRWETEEQAVELTAEVAENEELRARFAASSIQRAKDFSDAAFAQRWREICRERGLLDGGPTVS